MKELLHDTRKRCLNTGYPWSDDYISRLLEIGTQKEIAELLQTPLLKDDEINKGTKLKYVPAITTTWSQRICNKKDINRYAELPVRQSIKEMREKNIRTEGASANFKNLGSKAYVIIDRETLSQENIDILQEKGESGKTSIQISFDVGLNTSLGEIEDHFLKVSGSLQPQILKWGYYKVDASARFYDGLYHRKLDRKFYSKDLKDKFDNSLNFEYEEQLKQEISSYDSYYAEQYMWKNTKAGTFRNVDFIKRVDICGLRAIYDKINSRFD